MKQSILAGLMLCATQCFGWDGAHVFRKTLDAPTEIQGYPCDKGYAWLYLEGDLQRCSVSRETAFGEARVPKGSVIVLSADGKTDYALLSADTPILSYTCKGGGPVGPGQGASTAFYPSGKLKVCWLAEDQNVQGTPCIGVDGLATADFHPGGIETEFYESGKLRSCTLSRDVGALKRGQVFTQAP